MLVTSKVSIVSRNQKIMTALQEVMDRRTGMLLVFLIVIIEKYTFPFLKRNQCSTLSRMSKFP